MMDDEDKRSIEELCRPLSAKVQPRSAMTSSNGDVLNEAHANKMQKRENARPVRWKGHGLVFGKKAGG